MSTRQFKILKVQLWKSTIYLSPPPLMTKTINQGNLFNDLRLLLRNPTIPVLSAHYLQKCLKIRPKSQSYNCLLIKINIQAKLSFVQDSDSKNTHKTNINPIWMNNLNSVLNRRSSITNFVTRKLGAR